jgi:prevent-host-death family protein
MTYATIDPMKTIAVAKFKAQCLWIVDHLEPEGLIITKRGRPVARLLPIERASADLVGSMRGKIEVLGDIASTGETWDTDAQP